MTKRVNNFLRKVLIFLKTISQNWSSHDVSKNWNFFFNIFWIQFHRQQPHYVSFWRSLSWWIPIRLFQKAINDLSHVNSTKLQSIVSKQVLNMSSGWWVSFCVCDFFYFFASQNPFDTLRYFSPLILFWYDYCVTSSGTSQCFIPAVLIDFKAITIKVNFLSKQFHGKTKCSNFMGFYYWKL